MSEEELEKLKYPIGKFQFPTSYSKADTDNHIHTICHFPQILRESVKYLTDEQLNTSYRPDGWTIRQVIHHLVDSHINSYVRFKWTLTEHQPTIKAYDEKAWAELSDAKYDAIEPSLLLLTALHLKWSNMLNNLTEQDLKKTFIHPESKREILLHQNIALYAWHCDHHLAHIMNLAERNGW
ncbi:putative metal-dependent hydrolase [Reichenbachiella carrageenanivorans]|uniref:Metal-dependent hydrolase n=1 Tax=Reichenbachiella carrageenanivorans TaxID=2979869 RepID=A0ABY6D1B3_9BACT|nr:putative metal-dependent hydrolase [Reichenbachiella carrageenanivorans]UXX78853.1 putative metal-dependent hydrolase [Reichenbachiella carrageenanivorans]